MSWDTILFGLLILSCTTVGMILGAWIAARGFEKSLVETMKNYNEGE
jgi:uncharacterized protein YneF (UPF0154 family)